MKHIFLVASIAILFTTSCKTIAYRTEGEDIKEYRIHMVKKNDDTGNYLFRGNNPLNGSDSSRYFDYDDLVKYMNDNLTEIGESELPGDFYLIDISLLNISNSYDLSIEKKYFKNNPDKGEFINWPLIGVDWIVPDDEITKELSDSFAIGHDNKKLDKWITKIEDMLNTDNDRVTVIYVHCDGGCDRTGEMIGGYRMKYEDNTYSEAIDSNNNECGRQQNIFATNGTKWYCSYLEKESDKYKNICNW